MKKQWAIGGKSVSSMSIIILQNKGIAQTYLKQKNWKKAMEYFELSGDKENYSKAFVGYRQQMLEEHFTIIVIAAVVIGQLLYC